MPLRQTLLFHALRDDALVGPHDTVIQIISYLAQAARPLGLLLNHRVASHTKICPRLGRPCPALMKTSWPYRRTKRTRRYVSPSLRGRGTARRLTITLVDGHVHVVAKHLLGFCNSNKRKAPHHIDNMITRKHAVTTPLSNPQLHNLYNFRRRPRHHSRRNTQLAPPTLASNEQRGQASLPLTHTTWSRPRRIGVLPSLKARGMRVTPSLSDM